MEATPIEKRIDDLSDRVGRFEDRFERFEDKVEDRFDKVEDRFDKVDARFDKVDARFGGTATKEDIRELNRRLDNWGKIIGGGVVAIVASVIARLIGV